MRWNNTEKLTEKAEQIRREVYSIMEEWETEVRNYLTNEESQQLLDLLNKLSKSFFIAKEDINE